MANQELNAIKILKSDQTVVKGLDFKKGTEFHVIGEVVYMGGHLLQKNVNKLIYDWINNNPELFMIETRHF
jgi:hypothetical protein